MACKRPRTGHAHTQYPLRSHCADYASVQAECGNVSANELTLNSSGNCVTVVSPPRAFVRKPGLICVREHFKSKKIANARNHLSNILPKVIASKKKATSTRLQANVKQATYLPNNTSGCTFRPRTLQQNPAYSKRRLLPKLAVNMHDRRFERIPK